MIILEWAGIIIICLAVAFLATLGLFLLDNLNR